MLDDGAVLQMDRPQQAIDLMFRGAKHINVSRVPDWGADGASPEWLIGNMINIGWAAGGEVEIKFSLPA